MIERKGHYTKRQLQAAYRAFQDVYADQAILVKDRIAEAAFTTLFQACPRLDSVIMTMCNGMRKSSKWRAKAFREAMVQPHWDSPVYYLGVHQLESLLLGASHSLTPLKGLVIDPISHTVFDLRPEIAEKIYSTISNLEELHIGLTDVFDKDDLGRFDEVVLQQLFDDLRAHKVVDFLSAAPCLVLLSLCAPTIEDATRPGYHGSRSVALKDLGGTCYPWPRLERLTLRYLECTQKELLDLIHAHNSTLRRLELVSISLTTGNRTDTFDRIAGKLLRLETARLREDFQQPEGGGFDFDEFDWEALKVHYEGDEDCGIHAWTRAWEIYLVQGGDAPDPELDYEEFDAEDEEFGPLNDIDFTSQHAGEDLWCDDDTDDSTGILGYWGYHGYFGEEDMDGEEMPDNLAGEDTRPELD